MISRFFKKKPKTKTREKPKQTVRKAPVEKKDTPPAPKKLLTAEGWKRMMMRKTGESKK